MRRPSPKKANTRKRLELMLTAAMDWALFGRRPTNIVSSMAMLIQPISARTSGMARWRVGRSSERRVDQENMGNRSVYGGGSSEVKKVYSSSRLVTLCLSEVAFPLGDELEWSEIGQRLMWAHAVVGFLPAEQLAVQHGGLIGFGLDLVELLVVGTIRSFHVGIELR